MKQPFSIKPLTQAMMLVSLGCTSALAGPVDSFIPSSSDIRQAVNSQQLILAVGIFDPLTEHLDFQASGLTSTPSVKYGLVQFNPGQQNAQWLKKQGFEVIQSMSNHAYLVNWSRADLNQLRNQPAVRWFGPMLSSYKVSPNLWPQQRTAQTSYELDVKVYPDYPIEYIRALIKKISPKAVFIPSNIHQGDRRVAIALPAQELDNNLNQLAAAEGIQWIGPYYQERLFNNEAVAAVQAASGSTADQPIFDQGLFGSGQIVGVADSGLDHNEDWFAHYDDGSGVNTAITAAEDTFPPLVGTIHGDNKVVGNWIMPGAAAYDHSSASYHGTHVSGSVAGDRANCVGSCNGETPSASSPSSSGYDNDDGMAPNAQILFQDIGSSAGLTGQGSSPMWSQAYDAGVRIHSNSYGASTFGEYVSSDANVDSSLRILDDMVIVIAAGNDDGFNNTTGSPGNAKSAITVGALNHGNSNSVAGFSNRGLTDDGRLKPDISATGSGIQSAGGNSNDTNVHDDTPSRRTLGGTSMSTPITSGSLALLRQYFTDGFYPSGAANAADSLVPSGPLMKALLLNGTNTGPGFDSKDAGWGKPWLANTLPFTGSDRSIRFWDVTHESGLQTAGSHVYNVDVLAGEEFRATLTWYDLPGPTGSGITLVNDLNLTVVTPGGTYLGNNFNGSDVSVTTGSADAINTVEQVRFTAPVTGSYQITVSAPNIPGDGTFGSDQQGYALVVSGDLGTNSPVALGNPGSLSATADGLNGVDLDWTAASGASEYEVYRSEGSCQTMEAGKLRYIGSSNSNSFTDDTTIGGYEYAYHIRAFNADNQSQLSNCADVQSAQNCPLPPTFSSQSATVNNQGNDTCTIALNWDDALSNCPANGDVTYNIYRSQTHGFTPASGNLLATTSNNISRYEDTSVVPGNNYYYRVSAVNNGNETGVSAELFGSPFGSSSGVEGSILDNAGAGDAPLLMRLESPWSLVNDDSSAGNLSYRTSAEGTTSYSSNTCARMYSPPITIPSSPSSDAELNYQARYNIEADWDGVVVEISNDGGNSWNDLPPVGGYPGDFSQTGSPPINICGYPSSQGAINGNTGSSFNSFTHNLSAYHGDTVLIRWSFSTDPGAEFEGFYLDEISYDQVETSNVCSAVVDLIFADGFNN